MARTRATATTQAIGYVRVSTAEQANSGLGLAAQRKAIRAECAHRGWDLIDVVADEGETGKTLARHGLTAALERIATGEASVLVAAKLDRLSRSVVDFGMLLEWFLAADAAVVAIDLGVDTSTPGGRLVANVFASVAEWEADTIAARTKDGLAALRSKGRPISRPAVADDPKLRDRIAKLRSRGWTYQAIADALNADGVPTPRGGVEWRVSSVQAAAGYVRPRAKRRPATLPDPRPKKKSK